jgi:hypothetical protein
VAILDLVAVFSRAPEKETLWDRFGLTPAFVFDRLVAGLAALLLIVVAAQSRHGIHSTTLGPEGSSA